MKIKIEKKEFDLKKPFVITGYTETTSSTVWLTLESGGYIGRGESLGIYYKDEDMDSMAAQLEAITSSITDDLTFEQVQEMLPYGGARNALDCALWDLAGKKYGASISQLLGGFRKRLPVYASTFPGQKTPGGLDSIESYADFAEDCMKRGFQAFKIHGFMDGAAKTEISIMTAIRDRVGDGLKLMTDPVSSLATFIEAIAVGRACDDLDFYWYEDPYRDASSSAVAHKRLRDFIQTPMLIGEHIRGFEQKADFVLAGGTDILHIDPELDGGITGTMKLAHFADAMGMEIQLHTAGPMHRHCMSAILNTHFYELGLVRPHDAWNGLQPPIFACNYGDQISNVGPDGCVPVPTGPGLGVTYDWDKISKWEIARDVFE